MNNMNPLYQEVLALRQSQEIESELRQLQLQKEAGRAQHPRASWMAHRIAHFAEWLIATGEALRQRYDHESMHRNDPRSAALI